MRAIPLFFVTLAALAQERSNVLPLARSSPIALEPGTLPTPLTTEEKAQRALRNTFGVRGLLTRAITAGFDQYGPHPEEWPQGLEGYGMRYGSRMGRLATRNALMFGTDVAFGLDQRYIRCDCTGVRPRIGYAVRRLFVARKDAGGEFLNVSQMAGAFVTPMISNQWYPDRLNTPTRHVRAGSTYLGWQAGGNVVREFWPEIRRLIPLKRFKK